MSLSRVKTWIAGEVLTASDLNAEFNNILNNPISLISPFTAGLDMDGYTLTLDAAAATTLNSTAAISLNVTSGPKTGTPGTGGSVAAISAQTFTDSATSASGTAASQVFWAIAQPTIAASNSSVTTTDAATIYIAGEPSAGTNETITNAWALWVDSGDARFDDNVVWLSGTSFKGTLDHANTADRTYTFPDADNLINGATQNSQSAAYTTVAGDAGKHILHPTADNNARTFTIDSNANVAYPTGTMITFVNQINTVTIAITSDTLTQAGTGSTGSRTLAANGIATALKVASTSWVINGTGLS